MTTSNRSVTFNTDRGNDIYTENQRIIINISPESAPLINTSDSYLMFSLLMSNDKTSTANPNFCIPDPLLGGCPFENMTIRTGDNSTVLEQLDSMSIFQGLKNYYGNNSNDEQLQKIYEGRCDLVNNEFVEGNKLIKAAANSRIWSVNSAGEYQNPNRGGGFKSQFYNIRDTMLEDCARKTQIMYRFPMSGLLSSMKTELLPNIVLGGITIELTLMDSNRFLRVQEVQINEAGTVKTKIGYGVTDRTATATEIEISDSQQGFHQDATTVTSYAESKKCYGHHGYYNNVDTLITGLIPASTPITGMVINNSADGGNKYQLDNIENCSIKVGSKVRVGYTLTGGSVGECTAALIDSVVTSVEFINNRVHIRFNSFQTNPAVAGVTDGNISIDNPIICSLSSSGSPTFLTVNDLSNTPAELTTNLARYEVSNVEYVANVVETQQGYIETMVKQAQTGQLKIQFNTYDDIRVNIPRQALSNEMMIPTDNQRCYSILGINEILQTQTILQDSISPSSSNLRDYIFIMDGIRTPNQAVSLERMAVGRVNALAMIETEKALLESSIPLKDLRNPSKFITIGRRLGAYGSSVNLLNKTVKCRVNYSGSQPLSLLYHFFLYHTKMIQFNNGQLVVIS